MNTESGLAHTIRRLISKACNLKHKRVHTLLDELGLYPGQSFALKSLWNQDGLTQSELTKQLGRSPSTTTKKIQRMEKTGFVERRSDDSDERITRVWLTDAGREIRPAVEEMWQHFDLQLVAGFDAQELALFQEFLLRVCQNLENKAQSDKEDLR